MKYKVEVGSFVTRLIKRSLIVHAASEEEVKEKAVEMYKKREYEVASSIDCGSPQVDSCCLIAENGGTK